MRLSSISITNYRSITEAKCISLSNYSVILGKNNEGKTNILNAINLGMTTLQSRARKLRMASYRNYMEKRETLYNYKRDYPVSLQDDERAAPTKIILAFSLSELEVANFRKQIGISNNGKVSVELVFSRNNEEKLINTYKVRVLEKKGRGADSYKDKIDNIIEFLAANILFQYIPAVRTENQSMNILSELVNDELENINNEEYNKALEVVRNKQDELIKKLSEQISKHIKIFLPNIINTNIQLNEESHRYYRSGISFFVNDGTVTNLSYKGEGIKSLITLALLDNSINKDVTRIVAIEEPESHLHPEAVHQIHNVIQSIAENNQVIITTHNGIFVNRMDISSNIIINNGIGEKARNINEIRELLGIQLSDNLVASEVVVIVEGSDDVISFKSILSKVSPRIKIALQNNKLNFVDMGGASNLKYKCSFYASLMCKYFAIVDGDKCGTDSLNEAIQKGLLSSLNSAVLCAYGNKKESEFEDYIKKELYNKVIFDKYGVDINCASFKGCKKKWSDRLKDAFLCHSKLFNEAIESEIKYELAKIIECSDLSEILPECYLEVFKHISEQIERLL